MRTALEKGEKAVIEVKRHWVVLLRPVFFIFLSLVALYVTFKYPVLTPWRDVPVAAAVVTPFFFLYKFYEREVDIWAVTNMRVIDEWGVFTRNTRESPLDRINNVSYVQPLPGLLLGYGDVTIQTAAEHGETTVKLVTSPRKLKDAIIKAQSEFVKTQGSGTVTVDDSVECPWCAERIKKKARMCRYCGKNVSTTENNEKNKEVKK